MVFLSSSSFATRRLLPHSFYLLRRLISTTHPYDPTIRCLVHFGKFFDIDSLLKNSPSLSPGILITNDTSAGMINSGLPLVSTTQTLNSLLSACNHSSTLFRRVHDLFSHFTLTLTPDHPSYSILIKSRWNVGEAVRVFEDSVRRSMVPDLGTVRVMVEELVGRKKGRVAKRVVTELKRNFAEDFIGGWVELEKLVGLDEAKGEEDDDSSKVVGSDEAKGGQEEEDSSKVVGSDEAKGGEEEGDSSKVVG